MLGKWRARRGLLDCGARKEVVRESGLGEFGGRERGQSGVLRSRPFRRCCGGVEYYGPLERFGGVLRSFCAFGRRCLGYDGDYNGCARTASS